MAGRKTNGQFGPGNKFATGRPKRDTELDYLRALSDAVPLETWADICRNAASRAREGDAKAREWIAKYLIGAAELATLAKFEALGITPRDYVQALADKERKPGGLARLIETESEGESVIDRAIRFAQDAGEDPAA